MKRRWAVQAIAKGDEGAVRLTVLVERDGDEHPGRVEEPVQAAYELRGEVGGIYRRQYGEWATDISDSYSELESGDTAGSEAAP